MKIEMKIEIDLNKLNADEVRNLLDILDKSRNVKTKSIERIRHNWEKIEKKAINLVENSKEPLTISEILRTLKLPPKGAFYIRMRDILKNNKSIKKHGKLYRWKVK